MGGFFKGLILPYHHYSLTCPPVSSPLHARITPSLLPTAYNYQLTTILQPPAYNPQFTSTRLKLPAYNNHLRLQRLSPLSLCDITLPSLIISFLFAFCLNRPPCSSLSSAEKKWRKTKRNETKPNKKLKMWPAVFLSPKNTKCCSREYSEILLSWTCRY